MDVTIPKAKLLISDIECSSWIVSMWLKHATIHFCRPKVQANQRKRKFTLIFLVKGLSECQRR